MARTFSEIRAVPPLAIERGVTVMPVSETLWAVTAEAAACGAALAAGMMILVSCRSAIGQTTLTAARWWAVAALCAWSGVELAAVFWPAAAGSAGSLRFAAHSLSFCPIIAVLGAKRPQHVAWNFVVLSLWAIVALPAAENLFLHRGQQVAMGTARGCFLWILILLGPINFLPTRFWLATLLLAAGQVVALGRFLPLIRAPLVPAPGMVGLMLAASAVFSGWLVSRSERRGGNAYDRLWVDFRNAFGLFWALRVQQRVNEVATQSGWDVWLAWGGFRRRSTGEHFVEIDPEIENGLRTSLKGLLRRFVSNEWVERRLA